MKSVIKIGRDNSNDVIINEPSVSRNHAIITQLADGTYEIKDLGSSNGTFVNGQKIVQQIISSGDKLKVASSMVDWQAAFQDLVTKKMDSFIEESPFAKILKTILLGSAADNDIVLDSKFISAHHAKISVLKNRNYYLQDIGSSNGSFVNGARIISKNFSKTDIVKVGNIDLPNNWFLHENLKLIFFKDHKKAIWISLSVILLLNAGILSFINRCNWFGWNCDLTAKQMYAKNKNALVHIEHEYYYTVVFNSIKYYVGKNKDFINQTEANPDKMNMLPYSKISGNGCFIKPDGSILTSQLITNPWLYADAERLKMQQEVIVSKTIKGLNNNNIGQVNICGETGVLKWLQNKVINNQQNFVEANPLNECISTDSTGAIIQSVKKALPLNAVVTDFHFGNKLNRNMHNTEAKYYSYFNFSKNGEILKDTFYARKDSFNINSISVMPIADSLPPIVEGSPVFNARGELIGVVQQQQVNLLQKFIKQIKN